MIAGQQLQNLAFGVAGSESEEYNPEDPAVPELQQRHLRNLIPGITAGPLPPPSGQPAIQQQQLPHPYSQGLQHSSNGGMYAAHLIQGTSRHQPHGLKSHAEIQMMLRSQLQAQMMQRSQLQMGGALGGGVSNGMGGMRGGPMGGMGPVGGAHGMGGGHPMGGMGPMGRPAGMCAGGGMGQMVGNGGGGGMMGRPGGMAMGYPGHMQAGQLGGMVGMGHMMQRGGMVGLDHAGRLVDGRPMMATGLGPHGPAGPGPNGHAPMMNGGGPG
jgi:hypothetical protein